MNKRKLTLSVRKDLLDEVKRLTALEGRSVSSIVEEYFEYIVFDRWIEALAEELELDDLEPTSEYEVVENRPKGLEAARIVRELREGRVRRIHHE
jgi:hypothetical protein